MAKKGANTCRAGAHTVKWEKQEDALGGVPKMIVPIPPHATSHTATSASCASCSWGKHSDTVASRAEDPSNDSFERMSRCRSLAATSRRCVIDRQRVLSTLGGGRAVWMIWPMELQTAAATITSTAEAESVRGAAGMSSQRDDRTAWATSGMQPGAAIATSQFNVFVCRVDGCCIMAMLLDLLLSCRRIMPETDTASFAESVLLVRSRPRGSSTASKLTNSSTAGKMSASPEMCQWWRTWPRAAQINGHQL